MTSAPQPRRRYDASRRQAQAARTQVEILRVAHDLFVANGYAATTLAAIAASADVSVPTLYAGFETKSQLLRRVIETAFAGDTENIPVADRPTAKWVHDALDARELLSRYAVMCGELAFRAGAVYGVLVAAADAEPDLAELVATFEQQRLVAARSICAAVRSRGGLARGVTPAHARDVIWIANSPELYHVGGQAGMEPRPLRRLRSHDVAPSGRLPVLVA